jgi:hypothetical protein
MKYCVKGSKRLTIAAILLWGLIGTKVCAGEFKLIDPSNPIVTTGVYNDLKGHQDGGGALAIITYKGVIEAVPLNIGGTLGKGLGGPSLAAGASINLLPQVKAGSLMILTALYPDPDKFKNLKAILSPPPAGKPDITMSFGPNVSYVLYDGVKGKALFTVFIGAEWRF